MLTNHNRIYIVQVSNCKYPYTSTYPYHEHKQSCEEYKMKSLRQNEIGAKSLDSVISTLARQIGFICIEIPHVNVGDSFFVYADNILWVAIASKLFVPAIQLYYVTTVRNTWVRF